MSGSYREKVRDRKDGKRVILRLYMDFMKILRLKKRKKSYLEIKVRKKTKHLILK